MFRTLAVAAALLMSSGALAADYQAYVGACAPTIEKWERTHLRKIEGELTRFGAWSTGVIRWDTGRASRPRSARRSTPRPASPRSASWRAAIWAGTSHLPSERARKSQSPHLRASARRDGQNLKLKERSI